jgi:xylose dehydrogenase (NAD/NADP)
MDLGRYLDDFTERDWQETDGDVEPLRVAMIGLGWWVREEAVSALRDAELCETAVLVSRRKEDARQLASQVETADVGLSDEEYHDGAATDAYDAVYVSTPNGTHLEYVETAAEHDKAVLCEKPMEASSGRAEKMVDAARTNDVPLMVAYRMHTEPAVRRLRGLLAEGVLGDPVQIHGHMSQPLLEVIPDPDQWRLDPTTAGPGATVTDIGLYPLNTARFVLDADPVAVESRMVSNGEPFSDVPDEHASFTLEFPGDVHAVCTASQNAAQSSHLAIVGSEGTARLEPAFFPSQPRHLSVTRDTTAIETTFAQADQMREEFDYFADCVLSGRSPVADGEHGLVDMRVIEAVYEAAESGRRVRL